MQRNISGFKKMVEKISEFPKLEKMQKFAGKTELKTRKKIKNLFKKIQEII